MKSFLFDVQDKVEKNDFTVGVSKIKIKHWAFIFSNTHSLRWSDLSYLNSMKLAYQTWLSYDFSAQPWKLREYLKNKQHFESKTGQKGYELTYQKGPQQMQNFLH